MSSNEDPLGLGGSRAGISEACTWALELWSQLSEGG